MSSDELEGAGFFPRKQIFFDKVKAVQMSKMNETDFALVTTSTVVWCCKSVAKATPLVELMQGLAGGRAQRQDRGRPDARWPIRAPWRLLGCCERRQALYPCCV